LYGRRILENQDFRKKETKKGRAISTCPFFDN
jgi:hypothetical protein